MRSREIVSMTIAEKDHVMGEYIWIAPVVNINLTRSVAEGNAGTFQVNSHYIEDMLQAKGRLDLIVEINEVAQGSGKKTSRVHTYTDLRIIKYESGGKVDFNYSKGSTQTFPFHHRSSFGMPSVNDLMEKLRELAR